MRSDPVWSRAVLPIAREEEEHRATVAVRCDHAEAQFFQALLQGERRVPVLASVLGAMDLPVAQQRQAIKRARDRILARIRRQIIPAPAALSSRKHRGLARLEARVRDRSRLSQRTSEDSPFDVGRSDHGVKASHTNPVNSRHCGHDMLFRLATTGQAPVALVQPVLRGPGPLDDRVGRALFPTPEGVAHEGVMPIVPRGLD